MLATGRLAPGRSHSESDLVISLEDGPAVSGYVTFDDAGARFTGAERLIASASLNGPLRIGDRADGLLLHSEGSDYQRVAYSLPLGSRGIRFGANASHLTYDIVTRDFAALDAHGTSDTIGLEASYPLLRSRLKNVYLGLNVDNRQFDNASAGLTTTHYETRTATLGLYGNSFDSFFGGGSNTASLAIVQGRVDLSGSPNEVIDAITTGTAGNFNKLRYSISRLQALTARLSTYASLSGQTASKNLDSSEKFYLGGPAGIRAYPQDEGSGPEGFLLNLELRAGLPENFGVTALSMQSCAHQKEQRQPRRSRDNTRRPQGGRPECALDREFRSHLRPRRRAASAAIRIRRVRRRPGWLLTMTRFWLKPACPFKRIIPCTNTQHHRASASS